MNHNSTLKGAICKFRFAIAPNPTSALTAVVSLESAMRPVTLSLNNEVAFKQKNKTKDVKTPHRAEGSFFFSRLLAFRVTRGPLINSSTSYDSFFFVCSDSPRHVFHDETAFLIRLRLNLI